ncbi:unnamed protein product [Linum trigynum]|uniref:TCP domain-containing protein n=1 Tax=Linum trigynum TaxID=586398 RepID=A0AAV2FXJ3_9ROSI
MEIEELHPTQPPCKFSRIGNGRNDSSKIGTIKGSGGGEEHHHRQFQPDTDDGEVKMALCNPAIGGAAAVTVAGDGATNRLRGWHHSRIIRVSRASGGKDRHSKVWTSKGLRDRRVRLSVTTAIQFYDLQDRLGYDQPSKAVEWLIKAAADAIAELPSLNACFPDIPKQLLSDEKRITTTAVTAEQGFDSADLELHQEEEDPGGNYNPNQNHNHQQLSLSKSACSSNSETSKGSGLSLARSDVRASRVKAARERAKEKAAAKEKDHTTTDSRISNHHQQHHNINTIAQSSTFTELLTGGIGGNIASNNGNNNNTTAAVATTIATNPSEVNLFHNAATRPWPLTAMDYFGPGLLGPTASSTRGSQQQHCSSATVFPGQIQLGNSIQQQQQGMTMSMSIPQFNVVSSGEAHHSHHHHQEQQQQLLQQQQQQQQHFPFVSDHLMPVTTTQGGGPVADYNLNFTISSGLAGFNRGTLQSNSSQSPSLLPPQFQRFASPIDGSTTHLPFFIGGGAPQQPLENHHHHNHQQLFPHGLQLCYGDGNSSSRQSDHKGKGKNN